ncbi:MAG: chromosome segregation protein SMC [Bacteroidia bacterium]
MRLQSLEIKGFKSFGDKVSINFAEGVTAVVGPNGSGKSNVVDAMRWVLGEQKTRMLRSEKMENIIFNGTKTRNQANLAEVAITFENTKNILATEYSAITITRKLYRDGDSEYYLNNVQCRLKDITDLFLDTGIGPDSYSIIELKMVDEILSDKNNTIRMLLEEASGISKYKIRKKQTLQKLEETDGDLNRVNDLMFEIEKSLKTLEAQAKKAEKLNRIKDEYKSFSVAYAMYNIRSFRLSFDELKKKEQEQQDLKVSLATRVDTMEAAIQFKKTDIIDKEKNLSLAQKLLNEKLLQVNTAESTKKVLADRIRNLNEKQERILIQNDQDEKTLATLAIELEKLNADLLQANEALVVMQTELEALKINAETLKEQFSTAQKEFSELNSLLFNTRQELNAHETKIAVKQTKFESLNNELLRINEQNQLSLSKLANVESELSALLPQKEIFEKEITAYREKKTELESGVKNHQDNLKALNANLLDESRKLDAKTNQYQLTKNMLEQMDGYPESIKFLKQNHEKSKKAPLLSDIISCKEDYKIAIENYLEPWLNYFVAETGRDAVEGLNILSESSKGRANFFVLENFRSKVFAKQEAPAESVCAYDVVEFDKVYEHLFKFLLGHVFILKDNKAVADFYMDGDSKVVLLSEAGTLLKQKYSLAGGSVGLFDGKRTGKFKNLHDLEEVIKSLTATVEKLKGEIIDVENVFARVNNELKETNRLLNESEVNLSKCSASVTSITNNKNFLQSGIDSYRKTIDKLESEINILTSENAESAGNLDSLSEELRIKLNGLMDEQKRKQELVNTLQLQSAEASQKYNQDNINCIQQQNRIHGITRDLEYKTNQQTTIIQTKETNAIELTSAIEQLTVSKAEFTEVENSLVELLGEKQNFETALTINETDYYKAKGEIDAEERSINEVRKQKENADALIAAIHDEINDLKLKLNSLKERLQLEFQIDINEIIDEEPDADWTEEDLLAKVEKLKKQITDYGPVNPMALEQFKEIKERHDFILKEQEDLANAKASLMQTMLEIDQTAHEKFMDSFIKVRENFISVFRTLFREEDKVDLLLADPTNPLESDINIIAQPKGKRPLSIQQLSGGEKTLTATALLFGIYLLKPAPFCIFDEVDAPLDDNNIDKFIQIIKKFSSETQFIVITHNKKTMTATDLIYGITMVEQGVTQVVPVDMKEFAEVE